MVGIICGIAQGVLNSIQAIIFRSLSNTLIEGQAQSEMGDFDSHTFYNGAMQAIYMYVGYGVGIFVLAAISVSSNHILLLEMNDLYDIDSQLINRLD